MNNSISSTPTHAITAEDLEKSARGQGLENLTLFALAFARLAVLLLTFPRVARLLGHHGLETPVAPLPQSFQALVVAWAVQRTAKSVPWRCECLEQALAAKWLLRRYSIPSTLYFGSLFNGLTLKAHAWVRCGDVIVTGEYSYQLYTITAMYGDKT